MTPSQPNDELDKAIERPVEVSKLFQKRFAIASHGSTTIAWPDNNRITEYIEQLESAAKRSKELEKENGQLKTDNWYNSFVELKLRFSKQDVEFSTLRADYKQALDGLKKIRGTGGMSSAVRAWKFCTGTADAILSTPSAIAAMKGEV